MKMCLAFIVSTVLSLASISVQAGSTNDLVRCVDTTYISSGLGATCGGDTLASGVIRVTPTGNISVLVQDASAEPFTLYEVYWLSVGEPVASAQLLGHFVTDCKGNSVRSSGLPGIALVKPISRAIDIAFAVPTDMTTTVGNASSGVFLVYSRGPYSYNTPTPPCNPRKLGEYNTTTSPHDNTATKKATPFANPVVTPGTDTPGTNLQFLSGYAH
jgi:hypothetical protein